MWFETIQIALVAIYGIAVTLYIFLVLTLIAIEVRIQDDTELRANQKNLSTAWATSELIPLQDTHDQNTIALEGLSKRPLRHPSHRSPITKSRLVESIQSSPNTPPVTTFA